MFWISSRHPVLMVYVQDGVSSWKERPQQKPASKSSIPLQLTGNILRTSTNVLASFSQSWTNTFPAMIIEYLFKAIWFLTTFWTVNTQKKHLYIIYRKFFGNILVICLSRHYYLIVLGGLEPRSSTLHLAPTVLQSLFPTCYITLVFDFPTIMKPLISWFRCVWLGLELNFAGEWVSRCWVEDHLFREHSETFPKCLQNNKIEYSLQCCPYTLKNAGLNTIQRWVKYGWMQRLGCLDPAVGLLPRRMS